MNSNNGHIVHRPLWYILDEEKRPVPVESSVELTKEERRVAETTVSVLGVYFCWVSTVFLSLDHSHTDSGPPVLFGTMIFGGIFDDYMRRYHTWSEAEIGHRDIVDMVSNPLQIVKYLLSKIWWRLELCARRLTWKLRRLFR